MMNFLFFSLIDEEEGSYNNLKRLREIAAQNFLYDADKLENARNDDKKI